MTHMERALSLARRAVGSASPNPAVGAVVVRDGAVVGEGWTQPPGQAHAEVVALRQAGERAAGAALYTTLEPCNHFGRTPPCTQTIIDAGIAEVRSATMDPNPLVSNGGFSRLREAGIETRVGECEQEARELIESYAKHVVTGLPFVIAKFAASLDGKIATRGGESRWITGEEARMYAHTLRSESDAVMVGINTALTDDPQLTARDQRGNPLERQPLRVIIDSKGRLRPSARLLSEPGRTLVAVADAGESRRRALERAGAQVERVPSDDGTVHLAALMDVLGRREVTSVLAEGGSVLLGSLFDQRLVDKVVAFVAPAIIGGARAPSPVAGKGAEGMAEVMRLSRVRTRRLGADTAVVGYCGSGVQYEGELSESGFTGL